ncbi:MAG: 50S ribosomal protein L4 [Candidatus Pacebacteria bacterium]|nr:50S ribosomal protein L4 [Candidatus Paceibacterota bacterium]
MKTSVYDHKGKESRTVDLPDNIFGLEWNGDLVHQVVVAMQANARQGNAHTKDRSEVRGGGRKPWRQKGTGQARHGSRRSPIWVGGGVTFGPRSEKDYSQKINKKMRQKALLVALSQKVRDGKVLFVDTFENVSGKTKDMVEAFKAFENVAGFETLNTKKHNNVFMTASDISSELKNGVKNLHHVTMRDINNLNPVDVLNHRYLVITNPEKTVEFLQTKVTTK